MLAATYVAAIVIALAVPVSQLRTYSVKTSCCCPDPTKCHCPDHKADHSKTPSMRACHKSSHESVATQLPSFTPPKILIENAVAPVAVAIRDASRTPHAPPVPDEPYGPS